MSEGRHSKISPGSSESWDRMVALGKQTIEILIALGDHIGAGHASDDAFEDERRAYKARKRG